MNTTPQTFEIWYSELKFLAMEQDVSHLIGDAVSHKDAFLDGLTPENEMSEQRYAAANA
jgi:hypothetical protein